MPKRILIVDDEADFAELVRYRFADAPFEFEYSARGMDALNKVSLVRPDLVLLDVLLPDLDGLTLCEILNRQPGTRQLPVILISAADTDITRAAGRDAGAPSFLGKPVDFEQLKRLRETNWAKPPARQSGTEDLESARG
jgi:two-component system, OmpR family, phosphate regulon response regulator PhoB